MYKYEEIKGEPEEELIQIMTEAFNDDTRMHTCLLEDGPNGYNDGSLIKWLKENFITRKILYNETIIGLYAICIKDGEGTLEMFCIDPNCKNKGHGIQIWKEIEEKYPVHVWHIETPDYSTRNYHFYVEKCGFTCVGKKQYEGGEASNIFEKVSVTVTKATMQDANEIGILYDSLCDDLEKGKNYPGWRKDIYPTIEDAEVGINEESLYVARKYGKIVGTIILRHKPEEAYAKASWGTDTSYDNIYVIYTLAVHPDFFKAGIGTALMKFAEKKGKLEGMKAIRLDVVADNLPAIALYEKQGYTYIDTLDLGYSEYGLDWFRLYEKIL